MEASSRFTEDWSLWATSVRNSEYLYRSVPFAEFFDDATLERFQTASEGCVASEYAPETGIAISRKYGSRWTDILMPSKGTLAFRRELERSLETVTDAFVGEFTATAAAVNLFGARGVYRATRLYDMDEYSQRLSAVVAVYREDGAVLTTLGHKALASFYTSRQDSLVAENRIAVAETRDGTSWSEQLALTLTLRPARTWLGDLAIRALDKPRGGEADGSAEDGAKPNIVSGYWGSLKGARRNLTEVWSVSALVKRPYAYLERYDLEFSQAYETKLVTPEKLSLGASLGTYQELTVVSGLDYWTFGLELTLSARVMF